MRPTQTFPLLTLAAAHKHQSPLHHRDAAHGDAPQEAVDGRTSCQILATLQYPAGWQFSVGQGGICRVCEAARRNLGNEQVDVLSLAIVPQGMYVFLVTTFTEGNANRIQISSRKILDSPYDDTYSRTRLIR